MLLENTTPFQPAPEQGLLTQCPFARIASYIRFANYARVLGPVTECLLWVLAV